MAQELCVPPGPGQENFFSKMTHQRIRRGVFHSIIDLQAAINRFLKQHNDDPKPFSGPNRSKSSSPNSAGCLYPV
jgi:hypothetical protein